MRGTSYRGLSLLVVLWLGACGDTVVEPIGGGPSECLPADCVTLGANCGLIGDGCGGVLECGTCEAGLMCGGEQPNVCGVGECAPQTCEGLGQLCGMHGDGCGGLIDCGECMPLDPPASSEPIITHARVRLRGGNVASVGGFLYYHSSDDEGALTGGPWTVTKLALDGSGVQYLWDIGTDEDTLSIAAGGGFAYTIPKPSNTSPSEGGAVVQVPFAGQAGNLRVTLPTVNGNSTCVKASDRWVVYNSGGQLFRIAHDGTDLEALVDLGVAGNDCPDRFVDDVTYFDGERLVNVETGSETVFDLNGNDRLFRDGQVYFLDVSLGAGNDPSLDTFRAFRVGAGGSPVQVGTELSGRARLVGVDSSFMYVLQQEYTGGGPNTTPPGFRFRDTLIRLSLATGDVTIGLELQPGGPDEPGITPWAFANGVLYYVESSFGEPARLNWVETSF